MTHHSDMLAHHVEIMGSVGEVKAASFWHSPDDLVAHKEWFFELPGSQRYSGYFSAIGFFGSHPCYYNGDEDLWCWTRDGKTWVVSWKGLVDMPGIKVAMTTSLVETATPPMRGWMLKPFTNATVTIKWEPVIVDGGDADVKVVRLCRCSF